MDSDCRHDAIARPLCKWAAIELGPRTCPGCGSPLGIAPSHRLGMNALLLVACGFLAALSIELRSQLPYLLLPALYVSSRWLLIRYSRLVVVPMQPGRTYLWIAVLLLALYFIWAIVFY